MNVHIIRGQKEKGGPDSRGRPSYRWVVAWRVVDADNHGTDRTNYHDTRSEALESAKESGFTVTYAEPYRR